MVWKNNVAVILSIATQKSFTSQMSMTIVDEPFQSSIMLGEEERKLVDINCCRFGSIGLLSFSCHLGAVFDLVQHLSTHV